MRKFSEMYRCSKFIVIDLQSALNVDVTEGTWGEDEPNVWYIGSDYVGYQNIMNAWKDHVEFVNVGRKLNEIAKRFRDDFIQIDEKLRVADGDALDWNSSNIAERCPYGNNLILNACRLVLFKEALSLSGQHIFVVETVAFAKILYHAGQATKADVSLQVSCAKAGLSGWGVEVSNHLNTFFRGIRARLGGVVRTAQRVRKLRQLRKEHKVPLDQLRDVDVLIVVWSRSNSFSDMKTTDVVSSMGMMPKILRDAGFKVGFLSSSLYWLETYSKVAENGVLANDPVLLLEDTFGYFDILMSAWSSFSAYPRRVKRLIVGPHDLSNILAYEQKQEWMSWRPTYARLFSNVGKFCHVNKIKPKTILHLYENHSWERCLQKGIREHLAGVRIVGCQQSPFSSLYLNFLPSHRDIKSREVVDALMIPGHRFASIMREQGISENRLFNVGAIRYQDFFSQVFAAEPKLEGQPLRILAPIGTDIADGNEFVMKVATAAAGLHGLELIFNFHPLASPDFIAMLKEKVSSLDNVDNIIFSDKSIQDLITIADGMLYSDTTSSFEAISKGVPVYFVGREIALDYDLIEWDGGEPVRSVKDVRTLLVGLLNQPVSQSFKDHQAKVLKETLGPVSQNEILRAMDVDVR